jgi:putative nucleotidyltransferase with HDIG domain
MSHSEKMLNFLLSRVDKMAMKVVAEFQKKTGFELPRTAEEYIRHVMLKLKAHDIATYEHCCRVGQTSLELSQELDLSLMDQALSLYSGFLHDVGKLKVPSFIINKPSKLSSQEYDIMKMHTLFGVEIIKPLTTIPFFQKVSEAVLYHHERIDGNGYHQLSGEKIPLIAKIILIVDTVDAMSEDRAYRKGLPVNVIVDELLRCRGTQFDSQIVDVYLNSKQIQKKKAA